MQPTITNHIDIRDNRRGEPRAFIAGTRLRVQDVVNLYERQDMTAEEIAREYPHVGLAQIHASLAYYFENQGEIQAAIKSDREFAESMKTQLDTSSRMDADSDSVSS
ncbi:hypothetical protein LF1_28650 [Rubripirellula obstinata]|uniref:DUF433 domain-containing protein n=1 Tax=Rubripirellula obstinata TaxID=406547 RepID=A0A5B1CID2_9BACT|nr:DUF433 domain-containing protein [Rubripirellula obstinata]KAA1260326.1 hypothetical protein LF1_28650 [Rubripirellula obstinata]